MIDLFLALLLLLFGMLGLILFRRTISDSRKMPPGPRGLPVVGSVFDVLSDPPKTFAKRSQEFGDTITVKLGTQTMVILHDYETAKAALNEENVTGRDQSFEAVKASNNNGLIFSEGEIWKEHRRFAISTLRDLGMGRNWIEDAILEEISELIMIFKSHDGKPFDPSTHLMVGVSNVICAMIFGQRFDHSDLRFQKLLAVFGSNLRAAVAMAPLQFFPALRIIPFGPLHNARKQFHRNVEMMMAFLRSLVAGYREKASNEKTVEAVDYIARFHDEKRKKTVANSLSTFTDEQLMFSIGDLFAAGAETTTTTMLWAFIYMIEHPEVQRKVQEEMDNNIGSRPIRMADKVLLKYTDAVTLEIQRLGSIAPLGVVRTNFESAVIDGYTLPPRTTVAVNTYAMHRNPKYWSHPDTFYPEHFLDERGSVKLPKGFLPFGTGKRECLGEPLAKMEIFLFFANLLQNFRITAAENLLRPSSEECFFSITRSPLPYKICFVPRQ